MKLIAILLILISCNNEKVPSTSIVKSSSFSTEENFDDFKKKDESCDTEKEFVPPEPTEKPKKLQGHNDGGCKIE
jgi:hypothetical protein